MSTIQLSLYEACSGMADNEIIDLIVSGNEEAVLYLLYDRYENDLKFYAWKYFNSLAYLDDLRNDLYILLKGKNADWQPLKSFRKESIFRTWFCRVASNLFWAKRKKMIDSGNKEISIDGKDGNKLLSEPLLEPENKNLVMLMEAINRLKDEDSRLILIKELEGYNHAEIAEILDAKWKAKGNVKIYKGKVVVPDGDYISMRKSRILREEVKVIVEQIKKEWQ